MSKKITCVNCNTTSTKQQTSGGFSCAHNRSDENHCIAVDTFCPKCFLTLEITNIHAKTCTYKSTKAFKFISKWFTLISAWLFASWLFAEFFWWSIELDWK